MSVYCPAEPCRHPSIVSRSDVLPLVLPASCACTQTAETSSTRVSTNVLRTKSPLLLLAAYSTAITVLPRHNFQPGLNRVRRGLCRQPHPCQVARRRSRRPSSQLPQ